MIEHKGVVPLVRGGLGNQMFIMAAAYIAHKHLACPMYIIRHPITYNHHNVFNNNYNDNIFKYIDGTQVDFEQNYLVHTLQTHGKYRMHQPEKFNKAFDKWDVGSTFTGMFMTNYYQYYPTIEPFRAEICNMFLKGLELYAHKLPPIDPVSTAFLHIRRGDYLRQSNIHFVQPIDYYKKCVGHLLRRNPKVSLIYVISDDQEWIRSQEYFNSHSIFKMWDNEEELLTLALMTQCKAGAICGNSTFSWWGALMGAYSIDSPVFVPQKWFIEQPLSLFPSEWNIISMENKFLVIVPVYNAELYIEKCLVSILEQDYKNFTLVVIDDCSTDNTYAIINKVHAEYTKLNDFHVLRNQTRLCSPLANFVQGIQKFAKSDEDIVVTVDGDDWLSDNTVLAYLNSVYQDGDVYTTHGKFEPVTKEYPAYGKEIPDTQSYRKSGLWTASHLRTFKVWLWRMIDDADLRDPKDVTSYCRISGDCFFMYPMIEMCGKKHLRFIDKVLYIYNNLNPINDMKIHLKEQLEYAEMARNKTVYKELSI